MNTCPFVKKELSPELNTILTLSKFIYENLGNLIGSGNPNVSDKTKQFIPVLHVLMGPYYKDSNQASFNWVADNSDHHYMLETMNGGIQIGIRFKIDSDPIRIKRSNVKWIYPPEALDECLENFKEPDSDCSLDADWPTKTDFKLKSSIAPTFF